MTFTDKEIMEVFPKRGVGAITTAKLWKQLGSPVGKKQLLEAAKQDLPTRYASKEEAQAAGAEPGQRSAVLLAKAAIAVFANRRGLKPGSGLTKLEQDFSEHLPEFFNLCQIQPPK